MDYKDEDISLDNYFEPVDLNQYDKEFYDVINDEDEKNTVQNKIELDDLRNKNLQDYLSIDISKYENLPSDFLSIIEQIKEIYSTLESDKFLIEDVESSKESRKELDEILKNSKKLDTMVKTVLRDLEYENDKRQSRLSISYIKNLDCDFRTKSRILALYNDLILYNAELVRDDYESLKRQMIRKTYLHKIYMMLNIEESPRLDDIDRQKLDKINLKIHDLKTTIGDKISYLQDLIVKNSKYTAEFNAFIEFYNKISDYNNLNYEIARQTFEMLSDDSKFLDKLKAYEALFIEEYENLKKAREFVYKKIGIKNIKNSLDYISANYIEILSSEEKEEIEEIHKSLKVEYDIDDIYSRLSKIVKKIWDYSVTDIYKYNPKDDFCFICSNNQFIDPKYQCILITKKELEKVDDFSDYQIGFICDYNDNIMYITENEDIMTVDYNDMSNLKTPAQLEQEFINFKVCNRMALNGYLTNVTAVYIIDDGDKVKYAKAVELSNAYELPLLVLNKNS